MERLYFFRGSQYIRWTVGQGIDAGYPKSIASSWGDPADSGDPWMSAGLDAAVSWGNGKAYFFRGEEYARWTCYHGIDGGYPRRVRDRWDPWMVTGPTGSTYRYGSGGFDAAVNWCNGIAYFFNGDEYIAWGIGRYALPIGLSGEPATHPGYPRKIALDWDPFMREGIDAALSLSNGKAYFFRGPLYIRYTMGDYTSVLGSSLPHAIPGTRDPGYPKRIIDSWGPWLGKGVDAAVNWDLYAPQFIYRTGARSRGRLAAAHRTAIRAIHDSKFLSNAEKSALFDAYRMRVVHAVDNELDANARVPGIELGPWRHSFARIVTNLNNFGENPVGERELAQTMIHEMCHVAGYSHPEQATGAPGTDGPYHGATPVRAECSIAGYQSGNGTAPCDSTLER